MADKNVTEATNRARPVLTGKADSELVVTCRGAEMRAPLVMTPPETSPWCSTVLTSTNPYQTARHAAMLGVPDGADQRKLTDPAKADCSCNAAIGTV